MKINGKVISILTNKWQYSKAVEKGYNPENLQGLSILVWILEIDGKDMSAHDMVVEIGGTSYETELSEETVYLPREGNCYKVLSSLLESPVFVNPDTEERSKVKIEPKGEVSFICKSMREKFNKEGKRMVTKRGQKFVRIRTPLLTSGNSYSTSPSSITETLPKEVSMYNEEEEITTSNNLEFSKEAATDQK